MDTDKNSGNEEKRSLATDLVGNLAATEAVDGQAGQPADEESDRVVMRIVGNGRGAAAAMLLMGLTGGFGFDVRALSGAAPSLPVEIDPEHGARVSKIKAAAQERREQRNARRLAHANRGSRIDQTDF